MKKQKYTVTKWRNSDVLQCLFVMLAAAFAVGNGRDGFIYYFFITHAVIGMVLMFLLFFMRTLYRTDRKLPKWLSVTGRILRIYGWLIIIAGCIFGGLNLKEYADAAKNH